MSRLTQTLLVLLATLSSFAIVVAQESDDRYAGVPQSRTADGAFVLGDPDAAVKLIEFSDFLCTSCQNYEPVIADFISRYVLTGKAQFEYRMFPVVDSVLSPLSAALVECADALDNGAFWRAHDAMFESVSTVGFTVQSSTSFAQTMALDETALLECAAEATQYQNDHAYGFNLNVRGTPSLFVQFGDADPIAIATALPEQFDAIVNARRPIDHAPVTMESGPYAGMTAFRRQDGGFVLGSPDAPLTIVAFEDFLCPHCQKYQETVRQFIENHVRTGQAQFEFRLYPLVNPQFSVASAQIAECIGYLDLGAFWVGHDLLYEFAASGVIGDDAARAIANLLGIDLDTLNDCREGAMQFLIDSHLGQEAGVSGTPAVRGRLDGGAPQIIFAGQQAIDRGGAPIEALAALATGSPDASVGEPERSLLNDRLLDDISLLTGEPCEAPCWRNITPGETSYEDALANIEALESATTLQADDRAITFAGIGGDPCCQIISDDNGLISTILLQLKPQMQFGDVIARHGEPTYVLGQPFSDAEAMLIHVYPEHSMILFVMVAGAEAALEESSPVVASMYIAADQMSQLVMSTPLDRWKGFLTYGEYVDGEFDVNP